MYIGLLNDWNFRIDNIFFVDYLNKINDWNCWLVVVVVVGRLIDTKNLDKLLVVHLNMVVSKHVDEMVLDRNIHIHWWDNNIVSRKEIEGYL